MATNLTKAVNTIKDRVRQQFPDGVDSQSQHDLKVLLSRIEELQVALSPFARLGTLQSYGKDLIQCYHKDCVRALEVYREDTSPNTPTEIYYPA